MLQDTITHSSTCHVLLLLNEPLISNKSVLSNMQCIMHFIFFMHFILFTHFMRCTFVAYAYWMDIYVYGFECNAFWVMRHFSSQRELLTVTAQPASDWLNTERKWHRLEKWAACKQTLYTNEPICVTELSLSRFPFSRSTRVKKTSPL